MPAMLLRTALQMDAATFPPLADVNIIHMLTVVGKHVMIKIPSTKAEGIRLGRAKLKTDFNGRPMRSGHKPNIAT